jgi:hypothetical protein
MKSKIMETKPWLEEQTLKSIYDLPEINTDLDVVKYFKERDIVVARRTIADARVKFGIDTSKLKGRLMTGTDDENLEKRVIRLEREIITARNDRTTARQAHKEAEQEAAYYKAANEILLKTSKISVESAPWSKTRAKRKGAATALIMLSDLHLDEIVKPTEVGGLNAYNREIALQRLQKTAAGAVNMGKNLMSGFNYEGAIVILGGDMVAGSLHDDTIFNEESSMIPTVDFWVDHLAKFLETIADAYGPTHVVSVVGNHGRLSYKPRMKGRTEDSWDHLLALMLQRHLKSDRRFSWNIPLCADAYVEIYGRKMLVTHGDQMKGGGGLSGLVNPASIFDARKRKRNASMGDEHDHMWVGHFHTYTRTGKVTVNGSMKGIDEYAFLNNFAYEEPIQAFAVITREHGVTLEAGIYCVDRDAEGW